MSHPPSQPLPLLSIPSSFLGISPTYLPRFPHWPNQRPSHLPITSPQLPPPSSRLSPRSPAPCSSRALCASASRTSSSPTRTPWSASSVRPLPRARPRRPDLLELAVLAPQAPPAGAASPVPLRSAPPSASRLNGSSDPARPAPCQAVVSCLVALVPLLCLPCVAERHRPLQPSS